MKMSRVRVLPLKTERMKVAFLRVVPSFQNSISERRNFKHIIEHEDSLPRSQKPTTGPCTETDESSLHFPILDLQD
jgi:hypothetical protein